MLLCQYKIAIRTTPELSIEFSKIIEAESSIDTATDRFLRLAWKTTIHDCLAQKDMMSYVSQYIKDLRERIRKIKNLPKSAYKLTVNPGYTPIPKQAEIVNTAEIGFKANRQAFEQATASPHHHLTMMN